MRLDDSRRISVAFWILWSTQVVHGFLFFLNLDAMSDVKKAASMMGRKSAEVRKKKWGEREFLRRMREWGKLGGRPKGSGKKRSKRGAK